MRHRAMKTPVELKTRHEKIFGKMRFREGPISFKYSTWQWKQASGKLEKKQNKCVQEFWNDGFTAPGNENKGFEFKKRAKSTQNIELSSKYRFQNGVKKRPGGKARGVKKQPKCDTVIKMKLFGESHKITVTNKFKKTVSKKMYDSENPDVQKHRQACHSSTSGSPQSTLFQCIKNVQGLKMLRPPMKSAVSEKSRKNWKSKTSQNPCKKTVVLRETGPNRLDEKR